MSVFSSSEQSRETGGGIKVRNTKPVDRTLFRDKSGCVAVADQRVIFDGYGQEMPFAKMGIGLVRTRIKTRSLSR